MRHYHDYFFHPHVSLPSVRILSVLVLVATLIRLTSTHHRVDAFILPPFTAGVLRPRISQKYTANVLSAAAASAEFIPSEGELLSSDEFERYSQVDATIEALRMQLPLTLTKPLTTVLAQPIFEPNVKLTVLVADKDEIELLQSRDELIALSDVLVLGTTTAQQANAVFGGGRNQKNNTTSIECQIILDPSCQSLLVPWTAKVPNFFPGTSPSSNLNRPTAGLDTFEGLSEFRIDEQGKIERHCIRKVFWNGQSVNGPNIGQALRALQTTMTNIQNSPLFRGLVGSSSGGSNNNDIWAGMRDGLLEQAANVASSRSNADSNASSRPKPAVIPVASTRNITGWIQPQDPDDDEASNQTAPLRLSSNLPLPGTEEWKKYAHTHETIVDFCEQVIPLLSTTEKVVSRYFAKNVTLLSTQGSKLLQGQEALAKFFQGLSLARRSTGGSWSMQRSVVLDWKTRTIAIDYTATNNPWTISGQDIYTLAIDSDSPLIEEIRQIELSVTTPDGSVSLDGPWLMRNLASAVERSSTPTAIGPNVRDLFTDILLQQQPQGILEGQRSTSASMSTKKRKVSQSAAANTFYFMSELHTSIPGLWNVTNSRNTLPPAAEYLAESVEFRGYLGETLLRGSNVYNRAMGSLLATTRQSLAQKLLVLDAASTPPPRVELTPKGNVRLSMVLAFRVPPPGPLFPDAASVPLTLEIVSDYVLDPETGLVAQHKVVETRVNGQLTPGDVLSRSLQRFWKLESSSEMTASRRNNDDILQSVSEAMSWLRSFSSNTGSK